MKKLRCHHESFGATVRFWFYNKKYIEVYRLYIIIYYTLECRIMWICRVGCAVAMAVGQCLLTMKAWVQSQCSPCGICGRQNDTGAGLPLRTLVFPLPIFMSPILIYNQGLVNRPTSTLST
jgi:hypothetical protein